MPHCKMISTMTDRARYRKRRKRVSIWLALLLVLGPLAPGIYGCVKGPNNLLTLFLFVPCGGFIFILGLLGYSYLFVADKILTPIYDWRYVRTLMRGSGGNEQHIGRNGHGNPGLNRPSRKGWRSLWTRNRSPVSGATMAMV